MADQIVENEGVVYHESAGGFVFATEKDCSMVVLLITHEGLGVPKGHIHKNEDIEAAAIREIREETGIQSELKSIGQTSKVEYEFRKDGDKRKHKKRLYLFAFLTSDMKPLKTEKDTGEIASVGWINAANAKDFLVYQQDDYETAYQKAVQAID